MSLSDALSDIRTELLSKSLSDDLIKEIAEDNGINPLLLKRKIEENGITEEKVRNAASVSSTLDEVVFRKAMEKCEMLKQRNGSPIVGKKVVIRFKSTDYLYVGTFPSNRLKRPHLAVSLIDGVTYELPSFEYVSRED